MPSEKNLRNCEREMEQHEDERRRFEQIKMGGKGRSNLNESTATRPPPNQIIHLEGASSISGHSNLISTVASFLNFAIWLYCQSRPSSPLDTYVRPPRRILLHCSDGYTETSLLALTLTMLSRRCGVAEAYLWLQNDVERSFFVYREERDILFEIEKGVEKILEEWDRERDKGAAVESGGMERSDSGYVEVSVMGEEVVINTAIGGGSPIVNAVKSKGVNGCVQGVTQDLLGSKKVGQDEEAGKGRTLDETFLKTSVMTHPWYYTHFEGHFPSRILDFLVRSSLKTLFH